MNKRGTEELQYIWLSYIFLALIVVLTFSSLVIKVRDDKLFEQKSLAMDSSFMIDAISASPYDINAKVTFEKEGYTISFKKPCSVETYLEKEESYSRVPSKYNCYSNLNFDEKISKTPIVEFKKEKGEIIIISPTSSVEGGEFSGAGATRGY
ncbi:MAG: hypothetical protein PHD81_02190 [Candidatus Nanoarchaeia archaeon]|nr:hypothetical protein [Candidatus Nanoarchaeia archaeon]MDD5587900.1 hypothetical protein [Candidatus Nanoarchaeia archaeon]